MLSNIYTNTPTRVVNGNTYYVLPGNVFFQNVTNDGVHLISNKSDEFMAKPESWHKTYVPVEAKPGDLIYLTFDGNVEASAVIQVDMLGKLNEITEWSNKHFRYRRSSLFDFPMFQFVELINDYFGCPRDPQAIVTDLLKADCYVRRRYIESDSLVSEVVADYFEVFYEGNIVFHLHFSHNPYDDLTIIDLIKADYDFVEKFGLLRSNEFGWLLNEGFVCFPQAANQLIRFELACFNREGV